MGLSKEELDQLKWTGISIVKESESSLVILLYFEDLAQGVQFFENDLSQNEFDLKIQVNGKGEYHFLIDFIGNEYGLGYQSTRTESNYPPLAWIKDPKYSVSIAVAEKLGNGGFITYTQAIPVKNGFNWN